MRRDRGAAGCTFVDERRVACPPPPSAGSRIRTSGGAIRAPDEARVPSPVRERDRVRDQGLPDRSHPSPQPSPARERGLVAPYESRCVNVFASVVEGTPRSRGSRDEVPQEGQRDGGGYELRCDFSGSGAPLSRSGLTAGPPSPAEGGGRTRGSRATLRANTVGRSGSLPHPEVAARSVALEGALQGSQRPLEGSFEAERSAIARQLRMRVMGGIGRCSDRDDVRFQAPRITAWAA